VTVRPGAATAYPEFLEARDGQSKFCPYEIELPELLMRDLGNKDRPTLGLLMRRIRARKGLTLREMSARTGIPISTLSKVEYDRLTLTYDKLLAVSEGLQISLAELLGGAVESVDVDAGVTGRRSLGIVQDAVRVTTPNYDYYYYRSH
jgi:transcriptional regulator with XRE-family HTH domain